MGNLFSAIKCLFYKLPPDNIMEHDNWQSRHLIVDYYYSNSCTTERDKQEICRPILDKYFDDYRYLFCLPEDSDLDYTQTVKSMFNTPQLLKFLSNLLKASLTLSYNGRRLINKTTATAMQIKLTEFINDNEDDYIGHDNFGVNQDPYFKLQNFIEKLKVIAITAGSRKRRNPRKRSQTRLKRMR